MLCLLVVETQHDEDKHILSNYAVKTVVFSLVIVAGLVCNIITLSVLQHFEVRRLTSNNISKGNTKKY